MAKVDASVLAERDLIDAVRTVVRLKHRIAQRHELNEIEDQFLKQYRTAVLNGEGFELPIESMLSGAADADQ